MNFTELCKPSSSERGRGGGPGGARIPSVNAPGRGVAVPPKTPARAVPGRLASEPRRESRRAPGAAPGSDAGDGFPFAFSIFVPAAALVVGTRRR